jgi:hypothetical protein
MRDPRQRRLLVAQLDLIPGQGAWLWPGEALSLNGKRGARQCRVSVRTAR